MAGFELIEATSYLFAEVVHRNIRCENGVLIGSKGIVVGLLVLNDEIELVVKWLDGVRQYKKSEFKDVLELVNDKKFN